MHPIRFLLRHLWAASALTIVVVAVTTFILRFVLLPQAGYLLPRVERLVSEYAGRPVQITGFSIDWLGREPVLSLQDLQVYPKGENKGSGDAPQLQLGSLYVSLDPWALLTAGELRIGRLSLAGIRLAVRRDGEGRIHVEGFSEGSGATGAENPSILPWLLAQPRLALYSSQLELHDEASGHTLRFRDVNLEYENDDGHRQIAGALQLPAELGHQLRFVARFQGDPGDRRKWRGELYVKGRALQLAAEPEGLLPARLGVRGGELDLELWSHWERGRLTAATADLETRGVESHGVRLDTLGGLLSARRSSGSWEVDGERLHLGHDGQQWRSDYLTLKLADGGGRASAQRLDLAPLGALLLASGLLPPEQREMLEALRPAGRVDGLELAWAGDGAFAVRGDLRHWSNRPWREFPGIDGLDARIDGRREAGTVEPAVSAGGSLTVTLPKLFRDPLTLDHLGGTLRWRKEAEFWRLTTPVLVADNADLATVSRLDIRIPADGGLPILDLQTDYHDGDGTRTSHYLPVGIMPDETVQWLDRAIVGGHISRGSMLFRGDTGDFPFHGSEGRFEARFQVEDGILDYQPGWPRLEGLQAEVAFVNQGLHAEGSSGHILGGTIHRVSADIPDVNHATITIDGNAEAPAKDLLALLRETSLRKEIGSYFEGIEATGSPTLALGITIPLIPDGGGIAVQGKVGFRGGQLDLPGGELTLQGIDGEVDFDNDGIHARQVSARFRDTPIRVDATPLPKGGSRVTARGRFGARELLEPYSPFAAARMSGQSDWQLEVDIPGRAGSRQGMRVGTHLTSDLAGVAVDLPPPLAKPAGERAPMEVSAAFGKGAGAAPIRFRYGDRLRGEIHPGDDRRAILTLGDAAPPPLPDHGLAVTGRLDELELAPWIGLWTGPGGDAAEETPELRLLDLQVGQLVAFGHLFNEQRVTGGPQTGTWRLHLEGPDAAGELHLPSSWDRSHTVEADLERLTLRPYPRGEDTGGEATAPVDPRGWPALHLRSAAFTYDGLTLGSLDLAADPIYDGLEFRRIAVDSPHTHLEGRGGWGWNDGHPESWFNSRIDSRNLQQTLTTFGYPRTIADGNGTASLNLNWPGDPGAFTLGSLEGELDIDLNDLRILELDPGVGRILGLLRLDFANLFGEGIGFDAVGGRALLKNGVADIASLELAGDAADLAVLGSVDLLQRRYNLLVDLTPHLSSSLPMAGAIAAANPVVGAAIFLADRLMDGEIDKVATRHYTVTGGWDDPHLEKLTREARGDAEKALRRRLDLAAPRP
ncbi:YhdP family protein [Endothiovibrio diazotrophicus]